jgi:23S rRNA (guanosine2251-2'-O)-methyltransferase
MSRYVFGRNAVTASLQNEGKKALRLNIQKGSKDAEALGQQARTLRIPVEVRDKGWFDKLAKNSPHQGLCLELPDFPYVSLEELLAKAKNAPDCLLLMLDQIEDPHNLGALARSAEASGALGLVIPQDRSVQVTPIAEKAASGALSMVPVAKVVNISRALEDAKKAGFWVYGLDGDAKDDLFREKLSGKVCLVLGAEGKGLRDGVVKHCDKLLRIPMAGKTASLNVSVAGGVAMFEVVRQRYYGAKP